MSKELEGSDHDELVEQEVPGTISIMSRQNNTYRNPSLVQEVWEFQHDPNDSQIRSIIRNKEKHLHQRHSHQPIHILEEYTQPQQPDEHTHHSQLTMMYEKRVEYGLNANGEYKELDRSRKRPHIQNLMQSPMEENQNSPIPESQLQEQRDLSESQVRKNRTIDILEHKNISNINYLIAQSKEIYTLQKCLLTEIEKDQMKKQLMKVEIQCRKLKIGLRSCHSSGGVWEWKRRNHHSHQKSKLTQVRSFRNEAFEKKQKQIADRIKAEKKRVNQLATRESLLKNYYLAIKARKKVVSPPSILVHKQRHKSPHFQKRESIFGENLLEYQGHLELLENKRKILIESLKESKQHIKIKSEQILSEKNLLREELFIVQSKIGRMSELLEQQRASQPRKSSRLHIGHANAHSQIKLRPYLNKTKRKLHISPSFPPKQHFFNPEKDKNHYQLLSRVKSNKQFREEKKLGEYFFGKDDKLYQ